MEIPTAWTGTAGPPSDARGIGSQEMCDPRRSLGGTPTYSSDFRGTDPTMPPRRPQSAGSFAMGTLPEFTGGGRVIDHRIYPWKKNKIAPTKLAENNHSPIGNRIDHAFSMMIRLRTLVLVRQLPGWWPSPTTKENSFVIHNDIDRWTSAHGSWL